MSLATLIPLAIQASLVLMVVAVGLRASFQDMAYVLSRPRLLGRSVVAMNVVMPVLATLIALISNIRAPAKIALVTLALSPIPPFLPGREIAAGGRASYAIGIAVAASLLAIVVVPVGVEVVARILGREAHVSAGAVGRIVFTSMLVPLAAGILVRRIAPAVAARIARPTAVAGTVLLAVGIVPALIKILPSMWSLTGDGTLAVMLAFVAVGVAVGHALGGPEPQHRPVLALSTAMRHPGIAFAIVAGSGMEQAPAQAAIILYIFVAFIGTAMYLAALKRRGTPLREVHQRDRRAA